MGAQTSNCTTVTAFLLKRDGDGTIIGSWPLSATHTLRPSQSRVHCAGKNAQKNDK